MKLTEFVFSSTDSTKRTRIISLVILLSFISAFVVRILLTATRRFDADEFEHLHGSWMVHSGFLPYRDFWQNHTPLLYYVFAPLFSLFNEGIPLIFVIRSVFSAAALFIVWQAYLLARLDHDRTTSLLSALVLSCSYLFLHKTIEIRPDHFLVASWLGSLYIAIRSLRASKNQLSILASGFLLGIGMLATPKALLCLAAIFLAFFANWIVVNRFSGFLQTVKNCFLYGLGFLIPFGFCALFFYENNALRLFLDSTILDNLKFPYARKLAYLSSLRYLVLFILCIAGIGVCFREKDWFKGQASRLLLAIPMTFLTILFFFVMPASSPQTALVFVPLMAIFGGIAFKKCIDAYLTASRKTELKPGLLLLLMFLMSVGIPCFAALYERPSTITNQIQLDLIRSILKQTDRKDAFFDGNIAYVFRPQAYYYGSLIEEIAHKIEQGEIQESILQSLVKSQCKFVIHDDRIARLPENILGFLRNNYIPSDIPEVHVAGKQLDSLSFSGRKAKFWIEIPVTYEIRVNDGGAFTVDRRPYRGPLFLLPGAHEIVSKQPLRSVVLRAVSSNFIR